jgi:hypothetical protein
VDCSSLSNTLRLTVRLTLKPNPLNAPFSESNAKDHTGEAKSNAKLSTLKVRAETCTSKWRMSATCCHLSSEEREQLSVENADECGRQVSEGTIFSCTQTVEYLTQQID